MQLYIVHQSCVYRSKQHLWLSICDFIQKELNLEFAAMFVLSPEIAVFFVVKMLKQQEIIVIIWRSSMEAKHSELRVKCVCKLDKLIQ